MSYRRIFFSEEISTLQTGFDEFYTRSSLSAIRIGLVCAILLTCLFGLVDPSYVQLTIRFAIILPALIATYLYTYSVQFLRGGQWSLASCYFIVSAGFICMIYFTPEPEPAREIYSMGLTLCIIGASAVRIRTRKIVVTSILIIILYYLALTNFVHKATHVAMLSSAILITWLSTASTERILKDNYTNFVLLDNERKNLKKIKEKLENSDTLKSKLLSIITHDLKGPTKNTAAILRLLNSGAITQEEFLEQLRKLEIHLHGNQILLENLLKWSLTKIDSKTNRELVNTRELVEECIQLMSEPASRKGNQIVNKVEPVLIKTDPDIVKMIVRNLLSNAVKFTEQGIITCSNQVAEDQHILTVSDTGIGMSQDYVDRLFDWSRRVSRAGTGDEKGSGIGLLISGEFLESLGGNMQIKTAPGKGTSVSIGLKAQA